MQQPHCVFRKPVMGSGFACEHASLCHTPTGCSVLCQSLEHYDRCSEVFDVLVEAGRFALSYTPDTDSFTHGKMMKVQHGGLIGLNKVLHPDVEGKDIADISKLVEQAAARELPLQDIVQEMRHWSNRRRGRK